MLRRVLALLASLCWLALAQAEVAIGDSKDVVLQQTGAPSSRASRGSREFFIYPNGGRVEFEAGRVVDIRGPLPSAAPTPAPTPAPAPATPEPVPITPPAPTAAAPITASKAAQPNGSPTTQAVDDSALGSLTRSVEKMDTAWGERPSVPVVQSTISWGRLLVSVLLHFGVTLLALRIAFKIEKMDSFWAGTFAIVGIDAAVYAVLEVLGPYTAGVTSGRALESAVGALVMVGTIRKFCFSKRLEYAVATAMSVKLIVYLCDLFLFVFILNSLFG